MDFRGELLGVDAEPIRHQLRHLHDGERELTAVDLEELSLAAQSFDLEGRWSPAGDDQMEARRCVPAQGLDEPGGGAGLVQLVGVVDHQEEIAGELRMQDLGELRGERVGAKKLFQLRAAGTLREPAHVTGDVRDPQPQGVAQLPPQRGEVEVAVVSCIPGTRRGLPPRRQERRLAESRLGDNDCQPAISGGGNQLLQGRARDDAVGRAPRQDLRNRGRVHDGQSVDASRSITPVLAPLAPAGARTAGRRRRGGAAC